MRQHALRRVGIRDLCQSGRRAGKHGTGETTAVKGRVSQR